MGLGVGRFRVNLEFLRGFENYGGVEVVSAVTHYRESQARTHSFDTQNGGPI